MNRPQDNTWPQVQGSLSQTGSQQPNTRLNVGTKTIQTSDK